MDRIMTMFRTTPKRRHHESSNNNSVGGDSQPSPTKKPRLFSFDEVKNMIEKLSQQKKASAIVHVGLKQANFDEVAIPGHTVQECKDLIERLVKSSRRVRTLQEVLADVKDNLNKRSYTEIIQRASLGVDAPKRPPTAYLLYHQDRYDKLRDEQPLAAEVSKIVAEEWRNLSERKRKEYHRRHDELMKAHEAELMKLGLIDEAAPKRPKSARAIFISYRLKELGIDEQDKDRVAEVREQLGQEFESLGATDKQHWKMLHNQEMKEFEQAREDYIESHPHLNHATEKVVKPKEPKVVPPAAPKSALKFFVEKKSPENIDGQEFEELKRRLKEKFQSLSEKKLVRYIKKAIKDKERYETELAEFKRNHPDYVCPKYKPNITKEQLKLYASRVENRPTPPAPNAYLHYCSRELTDMHLDGEDMQTPMARMQVASENWRRLSDKQRQQVEQEHLEITRQYIEDMEEWLESQPEDRRKQTLAEEPRANPDYWRKKLNRFKKADKKKSDLQLK